MPWVSNNAVRSGLTYDQEFGILRARTMRPAIGQLSNITNRGFETRTVFTGQRINLATQAQLGFRFSF